MRGDTLASDIFDLINGHRKFVIFDYYDTLRLTFDSSLRRFSLCDTSGRKFSSFVLPDKFVPSLSLCKVIALWALDSRFFIRAFADFLSYIENSYHCVLVSLLGE